MKITKLFLAAVVVLWAAPALASGHGGAPAGASFLDLVVYEVQHFGIHFNMTLEAMRVWLFASPETGYALLQLATDPLCVGLSPMVSFLFGSPTAAVITVLLTFVLLAVIAFFLLRKLDALIFGRFTQRLSVAG